tara:strand:+ start:1021 stop:1584 length:564 start_codon:yes stop_codon:yes gene_type:complete
MSLGIGSGLSFSSPNCGCEYYKIQCDSTTGSGGGWIYVDLDLDGNITKAADDVITTTCLMYLTDTAAWSSGDVTFNIGTIDGATGFSQLTVDTETLTLINETYTVTGAGYNDGFGFNFSISGSVPNQNSTIFVARLKVVVKANDGTVKALRTFDTSECATVNPFTGSGRLQPSTATPSMGNCYASML